MDENISNVPPKKNSLPLLTILVTILFLLSVSLITLNYLNIYTLPTEETQTEETEEQGDTTTQEVTDRAESLPIIVSRYTDIELEDYSELYVSLNKPFITLEEPLSDIFVTYQLKSYVDSPLESDYEKQKLYGPNMMMEIINRDTLRTTAGQSLFDQEEDNIKNQEIEPIDKPNISWVQAEKYNYISYMTKRVIDDIEYPNTDYTFAFFGIPIYPLGAIFNPELENGIRLNIFVQAIKGDNIITLKSEIADTRFLGITKEEHTSCTEEGYVDGAKTENTSQNTQLKEIGSKFIHSIYADESFYGTALFYDFDCILDLLTSEKYYNKIVEYANHLVDTFEIKN